MANVEMQGFTVQNVEPCPQCGATKYATIQRFPRLIEVCCDQCNYIASGAFHMSQPVSYSSNPKGFIKITRDFFNLWNESVAGINGTQVKKIRIRKKREDIG